MPPPRSNRLWRSKADFFRPFRTAATVEAGENIVPSYDPSTHHQLDDEPDLKDLNAALSALVDVFPDLEPEVFREMLLNVSETSRVALVTEQLLKKDFKWARGRFRAPRKDGIEADRPKRRYLPGHDKGLVDEEMFRHESYKKAVKQVLYQEFRALYHSAIKAVMAEQNYSYTLCRPILQQLTARTWRFSLSNLLSRRSTTQSVEPHPYIITNGSGSQVDVSLAVKRTGSSQLDHELHLLFVEPVLAQQKRSRQAADRSYAEELNGAEAQEYDAMFDCECCYDNVPFEQIAACDGACHQLCFQCVRRSTQEAVYGQGWSRTIDVRKGSVRCFASATEECTGSLPAGIVRRALCDHTTGAEDTWDALQSRMAGEALLKSHLILQRCPFCEYAEVDETPPLKLRHPMQVWNHIATRSSVTLQIMMLSLTAALLLFTVPLLLFISMIYLAALLVPPLGAIVDRSWSRVYKQRRGHKFQCQNPSCRRTSCMRCAARWRDPHVCFENEKTSLRTAIESSATAAVKRTCPRCLLSFVKSSGCNKLVCNCGYTMCYICRQEITTKEGYGHFCQHFRPSGGRCIECQRCDLYGDEDEEGAIRKAATVAEQAWRKKEGGKADDNDQATQRMVDVLIGQSWRLVWYEGYLDVLIEAAAI
ncbi:hypothetical protein LTR86_010457 [Recurvomyces mirabilis]|nr:hypothetical protein LTR86_010457 [Recurvomyces mirabilis]